MTTMESPAIKVTSYDEDSDIFNKRQDDDDDLDKDLESFINERKDEESKQDNKYNDVVDEEAEPMISDDTDYKKEKESSDDKQEKEDERKEESNDRSDDMKDVDERDIKVKEVSQSDEYKTQTVNENDEDTQKEKMDDLEKGQKETMSKGEKEKTTDDEDSEPDDYSITDDQRRALEEIEFLKNEMGLPEEDPPEYDVKERLKTLNEELANDPTPVEKLTESKVVFKDNIVDLVAPPPNYPEEETPRKEEDSNSNSKSTEPAVKTEKKSNNKVLIEKDGKFELVNADDLTAQDLGSIVFDPQNRNDNNNSGTSQDFDRRPAPPSQPRPSTANGSSGRRNMRPTSSKPRASSAGSQRGSVLEDFNYNSPYAMSKEDKDLLEKQNKRKEEDKKKRQLLEKKEMEYRQTENNDAFQAWLRQKREQHRQQREKEQEEKKQNAPQDKSEDVKAAYKSWLDIKVHQIKKEKLLKKRLDMEATDGFYIRSRDECDQAFKRWLRHKNSEAKKARMVEKQRARLHRLAARRARKAMSLNKAITMSNAFRYVDYYGYRY